MPTDGQDQSLPPVQYRDFEDRVAFVTGGAGGIGRATALAFARQGTDVVIVDVDEEGIEETATMIERAGSRGHAVPCDLRDASDVQATVEAAVETFGRLDFACNAAGIEQGPDDTAELSVEAFDQIVDVDFRGVFLSMKYEIPPVLEAGGAIVNVASGAGIRGFESAAYTGAKHGVVGMTKAAALEYADTDLRVNAVCPGIVDTEMMDRVVDREGSREVMVDQEPIGRMGRPEEIANAVLWLCSDAASFVLGHPMVVDGGQTV